jgi:hypothetical protein
MPGSGDVDASFVQNLGIKKKWHRESEVFVFQALKLLRFGRNIIALIPPCYPPLIARFERLVRELWMPCWQNSLCWNWLEIDDPGFKAQSAVAENTLLIIRTIRPIACLF